MPPNFSPPPSRRIAYDRDDTEVFYYQTNDSGIVDMVLGDKQTLNNESDDSVDLATQAIMAAETDERRVLAFLFTQAVQLLDARIIYDMDVVNTCNVEWSDDTTNGRDGSWTLEAAGITVSKMAAGVRPEYRNNIASVGAAAAHKGWRFVFDPTGASGSLEMMCVHLYAEEHGPDDRLAFWDGSSDEEMVLDQDFEDNARGSRYQGTLRIKNVSGSKTANLITLAVEQGPSSGRPDTWTLLSTNGIDYSAQVSLGNLGPGTLSGIIYWRCVPPVSAQLLTLSTRLTPTVGSWS